MVIGELGGFYIPGSECSPFDMTALDLRTFSPNGLTSHKPGGTLNRPCCCRRGSLHGDGVQDGPQLQVQVPETLCGGEVSSSSLAVVCQRQVNILFLMRASHLIIFPVSGP